MGRLGEETRSDCRYRLLPLNSHGGIAFDMDHKPRLSCFPLQVLPPLADRPVTVAGEHPSEPLPGQLLVDQDILHPIESRCAAVPVHRHRLDLDHLGEDEDGGTVLRLGPKVLTFLRSVDASQPDLLSPALV